MLVTSPVQPPEEPCSLEAVDPGNAIFSLRTLTDVLPAQGSLHSLGQYLGLDSPVSLRAALQQGTWRVTQPQFTPPPLDFQCTTPIEGSLTEYLRGFARLKNPREMMIEATIRFLQGDATTAFALADLAVTGRDSYRNFVSSPDINETRLQQYVVERLNGAGQALPSNELFAAALQAVLDRAYKVAHALRAPYPARTAFRRSLGWIYVSGEDDPPHRPVNVVSAPYPQYNIPVVVDDLTVETRFFIATPPSVQGPSTTTINSLANRTCPVDVEPVIPEEDHLILFIHGHSSRAEEALEIIPWLQRAGLAQGVRFSILAMDLPNCGYSSMFDHLLVAPSHATEWPEHVNDQGPIKTPILDFLELFILAFIDALEERIPIKHRIAGVIGGSLGGSLGLRLGRTNPDWLARGSIVSWDPASVWKEMVANELYIKATGHCRDKWDEKELYLVSRKNYFAEVFKNEIYRSDGYKTLDAMLAAGSLIVGAQPSMWYRDDKDWQTCKEYHIASAHIERQEIYNRWFRQWHWRVAGEQLLYSHKDRVVHNESQSPRRYTLNTGRQLLAAGEKDSYKPGADIYGDTMDLARKMTNTPGRSLFLKQTGHSIHVERPKYFAEQIIEFLLGDGK